MRTVTSADAKKNFGELIDLARAAPDMVTKCDRHVVVIMPAEEFGRLVERTKVKNASIAPKKLGK